MTSIEWLLSELEKVNYHPTEEMIMYAKKLHKAEHGKTWDGALIENSKRGGNEVRTFDYFDDYFDETFGSKGSDDHISNISKMVEVPQQENLYTEEQVREAIDMADKYCYLLVSEKTEIIQSLKPKKD